MYIANNSDYVSKFGLPGYYKGMAMPISEIDDLYYSI